MAERIQDIVGRLETDRKVALAAHNFRAARSLRDIQIRMTRANLRGWLAQDMDVSVETPDNRRIFSPEQLQGLESIGFTFVTDVKALSLDQLSKDPSVKHFFAYITDIAELRSIVPVARQIAVNPKQPYVEGSQDLGYDDQLEVADKVVRKLKSTRLKGGALEGVDFAPDRASVLSQLDFAYQARFDRRKLYPDYFVRSQDEYGRPGLDPSVAIVGRGGQGHRLSVSDWHRLAHDPRLGLSLVATPSGTR